MTKTIFDSRNISMMMDLYELTMANGYFTQEQQARRVAFDVFYRRNPDESGFAIFAGLEQILQYLEGMHFDPDDIAYLRGLHLFSEDFLAYLSEFRFTGDVYAFPEGTVMYPNEPIITVVADLVQAQIVETELLAQVNHQSLVATKANRVVRAAQGRAVSDFGARRAHNNDAAVLGARACYIGGVTGTATVSAAQEFDIPVGGTMAHSWVMYYQDELTAFRKFAEVYPDNCILLVDTYDVLKQGVPNAIRVFDEMKQKGIRSKNYGIRLDSGDLAYLSREARRMLDDAGYADAKIVVSNSLDEYTITSILDQGGRIDSFGVGERMITAKSDPVFGQRRGQGLRRPHRRGRRRVPGGGPGRHHRHRPGAPLEEAAVQGLHAAGASKAGDGGRPAHGEKPLRPGDRQVRAASARSGDLGGGAALPQSPQALHRYDVRLL